MPTYKMRCPNCHDIYNIRVDYFEDHDKVKATKCTNPECDATLVQVYDAESGKVFLDARLGTTRKGFL